MIFFLFKKFFTLFQKFIPGGAFFTNQHLLVLDGHGNHVTLETIKQTQDFGLNMITLPSHTSHFLQPLDVSCFKSFKTTLRKVRDAAMFRSNHMELDKITIVGWVNQAINQSFTKRNIKAGFTVTNSWPFNPKVMDNQIQPLEIYTITSINNHGSDQEEYISDEEIDCNQSQQLKEEFVSVEFFHKLKHQSIKQHLKIILPIGQNLTNATMQTCFKVLL